MRNFYLFLTNRNMATRLNVVNPALREARNDLIYPPSADFRWDFTSSIIPQQSMGSITFTRATTATVTDNDWIIRNCLSGEARFQWARRVQNLHTYSEDITNAAWTPTSCTRTKNAWIAPDGTITSWLVTSAVATALTYFNQNYDIVSGQTYILSVSLKANGWLQYVQLVWNSGTFWMWYINVDLSNGTITANVPWAANMQATVTPEANWFYRIQFKATAIATLANNHLSVSMIPSGTSARVASFPWDGIKWFYYWHPQFEDVTGQSVQTAAEYVSTNVLSSPFHGANVDWVKYFDTDANWVAIPNATLKWFLCEWARTNLFLQSEDFVTSWAVTGGGSVSSNQWLAPNGFMWMDKFIPWVTTIAQYIGQPVTTTANTYTQSVYVKSSWYNYIQMWCSSSISSWYVNFDLSTGTVTASSIWTGVIEALPNGVYRCSAITWNVLAATGSFVVWLIATPTSTRASSFGWNGTDWIFLWWAQFETWQNASSYIPTTTTTATRNIDVLTYDVRNAIANKGAFSAVFTMDDPSQFERRAFSFSWANSNRLQFQVRTAGWSNAALLYWDWASVQSVITTQNAWTNNIAVSWTNWVGAYVFMNNTKYSSGSVPNLIFAILDVGGGSTTLPIFWCVKNVRIWKTRPTDAELLALSNSSY